MITVNKEVEEYSIPIKIRSGLKWTFHLLYFFVTAIFGGAFFIPLDKGKEAIFMKGFSALLVILFLYTWIFIGILRRSYLELNEKDIKIKTIFGSKKVNWSEIQDIQVFTQSHNTMVGIVLKEKTKKQKQSFWNELNDLFGGRYSVRIPLSQFPSIDIERLYFTMLNRVIKLNSNNPRYEITENENSNSSDAAGERKYHNLLVTLIQLIVLSIGIGLVYGFSIHIIEKNIIIIPIFGSMAIIYYYNKLHKVERINIFIRIIIGVICALQVFIAVFMAVFMASKLSLNISNLTFMMREYVSYVAEEPFENGITILLATICFVYGAMQGHKFGFQKQFGKLFMKKHGRFYYKKDGRLINIYLIDPALYDENQDGKLIGQIPKDCLLEKDNKHINAVYIPTKAIEDLGLYMGAVNIINISDKSYYKIDLESSTSSANSAFQQYVFPCILITNSKKEVELIQIEV
jgi:hypothetical protein